MITPVANVDCAVVLGSKDEDGAVQHLGLHVGDLLAIPRHAILNPNRAGRLARFLQRIARHAARYVHHEIDGRRLSRRGR